MVEPEARQDWAGMTWPETQALDGVVPAVDAGLRDLSEYALTEARQARIRVQWDR